MPQTQTVRRRIRVNAIVELDVAAGAAASDINDIVGFFVVLHDVSGASERETLRFRILNIYPQHISVKPLIRRRQTR